MPKNAKKTENVEEKPPFDEKRRFQNFAGPGRPPGQKNYAVIYREALIKIGEQTGIEPDELERSLVTKAFTEARKGNFRFYQDLMDRLHGKPAQSLSLTGKDGDAIQLEVGITSTIERVYGESD